MHKQFIRIAAIALLILSLGICAYSLVQARDGGSASTVQGFGGGGSGGFSAGGQGMNGGPSRGFAGGGGGAMAQGADASGAPQFPASDGTGASGVAPSPQDGAGAGAGADAPWAQDGAGAGTGGDAPSAQGARSGGAGFGLPDAQGIDGAGDAQAGRGFGGRGGGFSAASDGKTGLVVYSFAFVAIAALGVYAVFRRKAEVPAESRKGLVWVLLGSALLLRIAVVPWVSGHQGDLNFFRTWASQAAEDFAGFYKNGSADYPPLYIYVLYAIGKLLSSASLGSYAALLYKLPSMIADVATAGLLFAVSRRHVGYTTGLLVAVLYALNPAVIVNSTYWGQVDSLFTLLVTAAVWLLTLRKAGWASALFMAAILMKPQGIIFSPVLFFGLVSMRQLRAWMTAAASAVATLLVVVLPFSLGQSPLWLYRLYTGTVSEYPYATVNGYNLFALLGLNYKADDTRALGLSYHAWGLLFIVLTTLFAWRTYARSRRPAFAAASAMLLISGVFTLSTGMHERYLFPAAALALLAYVQLKDRILLWLAAGFSVTIFVNTYVILFQSGDSTAYTFPLWAVSTMNVALFGSAVLWAAGFVRGPSLPSHEREGTEPPSAEGQVIRI